MKSPPYTLRVPPQGGEPGGPAKQVPRAPREGAPAARRGAVALLALACWSWQPAGAVVLDDLRDDGAWKASASDQVKASLRRDRDGSLCLDHDFAGVSGYAVMRRELPQDWPEDFALTARLKGRGQHNDLQIKLVDASGDNVWWINRPAMELPARLTDLRFKRRHVQFAWGPTPDKALRQTRYLELVMVAGQQGGGAGTLCLSRLDLEAREPAPAQWPEPELTRRPGQLLVDFQRPREFNGLWLDWPGNARSFGYRVQGSMDGRRWTDLRQVAGSATGPQALFLPEQEWRHLRLDYPRGQAAPALQLRDAGQWPDRNAVVAALAAALPRGELPRAFVGEQNYWTVIGVDGGAQRSALMSEDGALELGRGGPSVEPALLLPDGQGGQLVTWAQAQVTQSLRENHLPLPAVQWRHEDLQLRVEAVADGPWRAPELAARYTLSNRGDAPRRVSLLLALRPWQVNPPQQFLSTPGGVSRIDKLSWQGGVLAVNEQLFLRPLANPGRVLAAPLDAGLGLAALQQAPLLTQLDDPQGLASGLLRFDLELAPGESRVLGFVASLQGSAQARKPVVFNAARLAQRFETAANTWRARLGKLKLDLPPQGQPVADSMRSALAQILVSRDGPALRPGTRSYARSWVRDGAMMVAGLLRMGEQQAAREFTDWYAGHIFDSGKVPCCVDQRGADPVVENDSHGQYLYAVAELWRHTQDRALLQRHWPHVQKVMAWMEALRQSERTDANRVPERARFFGLMPPSISHEGYSDKAAYSYWDDFWALRGYKDAVQLAQAMGQPELAGRWAVWRDEFATELSASVAATAAHYGLDHIAGAADRGDFDATSTTMALNPAQAQDQLPPELLTGTFRRYAQQALARAEGTLAWKDYTPYELRNISALVRLGELEQAHRLLAFFFKDQRPQGWNQWAEVVLPNPREARFLGDMPHAWVSSDYLRAALDLLAYERESTQLNALVLAAGLPLDWKQAGDVSVAGLSTAYGRLDYQLARRGERAADGWTLTVGHVPERLDEGELRLAWPGTEPLPRATFTPPGLPEAELSWQGRELVLPRGVTTVQLTLRPPEPPPEAVPPLTPPASTTPPTAPPGTP